MNEIRPLARPRTRVGPVLTNDETSPASTTRCERVAYHIDHPKAPRSPRAYSSFTRACLSLLKALDIALRLHVLGTIPPAETSEHQWFLSSSPSTSIYNDNCRQRRPDGTGTTKFSCSENFTASGSSESDRIVMLASVSTDLSGSTKAGDWRIGGCFRVC